MICTEGEARTKWCPMVRHEGDSGASFNRGSHGDEINRYGIEKGYGCHCIASGCMMWRREKDTYGDNYGDEIQDDRGFCGLGGKI